MLLWPDVRESCPQMQNSRFCWPFFSGFFAVAGRVDNFGRHRVMTDEVSKPTPKKTRRFPRAAARFSGNRFAEPLGLCAADRSDAAIFKGNEAHAVDRRLLAEPY